MEIDLINQGQVLVAFGVLDFVDADGIDGAEGAVLQSIGDDILDGIEDLVPRSAEGLSGFFPGKPARPTGQEQHVGIGQLMFAIAPGDLLDDHGLAAGARDTPHRVEEEDQEAPERDEFVTPLGELIVTGGRLVATGTDGGRTFARTDSDLNTSVIGTEAGLLIDEAREMMAVI
jgi:hypothetical protein